MAKCHSCEKPAYYFVKVKERWRYFCETHFKTSGLNRYMLDLEREKNEK